LDGEPDLTIFMSTCLISPSLSSMNDLIWSMDSALISLTDGCRIVLRAFVFPVSVADIYFAMTADWAFVGAVDAAVARLAPTSTSRMASKADTDFFMNADNSSIVE